MPENPHQVLAEADTTIGHLVLRRREMQASPGTTFVELLVDGRMLMSDYNTLSERALARAGLARCAPDGGLRVLVGGLGLGHTAHAVATSSRVTQIDVVEFVPEVTAWFEQGRMDLAPALLRDPRFRIVRDDVYRRLTSPPPSSSERYDLVLVDVDHSPDDPLPGASGAFYTAAGLRAAAGHLTPRGVLGIWSCRDAAKLEETMREVFRTVETETTVFRDEMFFEDDETNFLLFGADPRGAPGPVNDAAKAPAPTPTPD